MILEILYGDSVRNPDVIVTIPVLIPNRYHKKKRIRKKWLKRYGVHIEEWRYQGNFVENEDGSYGFEGRRI